MSANRPDAPARPDFDRPDFYRIVPTGDAALTVEFEERIDPEVNARAIALAEALAKTLSAPHSTGLSRTSESGGIAGIRDIVPTYRSVTVYFDPLISNYEAIRALVEQEAVHRPPAAVVGGDPLRIPVCYGGEFGPDLPDVAAFGHLHEDEVVRLHAAATYHVFMLGFLPGFAYLGLLDERIAAPRRRTPRLRVPRGSVAIADRQTGVYPVDSPGGWQVIGRTPVRPFDPGSAAPFLMKAGAAVRFYPIDRVEYDRLRGEG